MNAFWHNHKWSVAFLAIAALFVLLSVGSALRESLVYDEIFYIQEGKANLTTKIFNDPYNPPLVRELTALPLVFLPSILPQSNISAIRYLPARLVTIILGVILLWSVYVFVKRRVDPVSAVFAVLLFALEPTVLAHSHYITSDIGVTLFFFLAYWAWLVLLRKHTWRHAVFLGIAVGLAFASKISAIPYVLVSAAAALFFEKKMFGFRWLWKKKRLVVVSLVITMFVVWSTYFFQTNVIIAGRDDSNRVSERILQYAKNKNLNVLVSAMYVLQHQPVPLGDYLATVKNTLLRPPVAQEEVKGSIFMNIILKMPIPLMLFAVIGLWQPNIALYIIPIVAVFATTLNAATMPWVRYVLPAYPFLAIIAAIGVRKLGQISPTSSRWAGLRGVKGMVIAGLLLWYVVGSISAYPHFISYANEFAGPAGLRYQLLTDSNIDWGQSLPDIADFVRREQPGHLSFSYFGRDNGNPYGLMSNRAWGSYRFSDICAFHEIVLPYKSGKRMIAISVSNWYGCGYSKVEQFSKQRIRLVVGDSILIF